MNYRTKMPRVVVPGVVGVVVAVGGAVVVGDAGALPWIWRAFAEVACVDFGGPAAVAVVVVDVAAAAVVGVEIVVGRWELEVVVAEPNWAWLVAVGAGLVVAGARRA